VPFRSKAQARFMFAKHPRIAARWVKESGKKHPIRNLPARKRRKG
jgi:hypothetical protein